MIVTAETTWARGDSYVAWCTHHGVRVGAGMARMRGGESGGATPPFGMNFFLFGVFRPSENRGIAAKRKGFIFLFSFAVSDTRNTEHGGRPGAGVAGGVRILYQVDAVGRDDRLQPVPPAARQLFPEALLQHLERNEGGG